MPAFLVGWLAGLSAIVIVAALLTSGYEEIAEEDAVAGIGWARIAVGTILLSFALKKWLGRPTDASGAEMPGWMSAISDFSPLKALGVGLALTVLNPKNVALAASAGTAVGGPGLSTAEALSVAIIFILVSTLGVAGPVIYYALGGDTARGNLDRMKSWLTANNTVVMTVLMIVIGAVLIGEGLRLL